MLTSRNVDEERQEPAADAKHALLKERSSVDGCIIVHEYITHGAFIHGVRSTLSLNCMLVRRDLGCSICLPGNDIIQGFLAVEVFIDAVSSK